MRFNQSCPVKGKSVKCTQLFRVGVLEAFGVVAASSCIIAWLFACTYSIVTIS